MTASFELPSDFVMPSSSAIALSTITARKLLPCITSAPLILVRADKSDLCCRANFNDEISSGVKVHKLAMVFFLTLPFSR